MWHEARRREKATQKLFIEHKKRAEKRREENRVDPNSLLQIHGIKSKLHLDPSVYKQAAKSLVAWQGDKSVTIDRFDVRATLTSIPRGPDLQRAQSAGLFRGTVIDADQSEPMKRVLDYERYRLAIQNDLAKMSEELRLKLVAKSEVASDAKLRKLRNNKFGTSGETALSTAKHFPTSQRVESRRLAPYSGPTYNSVPPPSSLSDERQESNSLHEEQQETLAHESILQLMESDEFNNFDLDGVSLAQVESKRLELLAKKYGFNERELTLLAQADSQDLSLSKLLSQLEAANRKESSSARNNQDLSSDQVYGPALPPELASAAHESSSGGEGSPVAQRSPSGGDIPLRAASEAEVDEHQALPEAKTPEGPEGLDLAANEHVSAEPNAPELAAQPDQSRPMATDRIPSGYSESSCDERDKSHSSRTRHKQTQEPRRASTPLAYKRNRRSSRSLSRERRSSQTSNHRRRSSRQRSRHRSRSSSSSRSSRSSSSRGHTSRRRRRTEQSRRRRRR